MRKTGLNVLLVEDEVAIGELVYDFLDTLGYCVKVCKDVSSARLWLIDQRPDIILLDWMLPGTSGLDFARELHRHGSWSDIPFIMLTARNEEYSRLAGFQAGADDYITKPFSLKELAARIKAVLRRLQTMGDEEGVLRAGDLELNRTSHEVLVKNRPVTIGATEFRLLGYFMLHPGHAYSRQQIIDRVWGGDADIQDRTVDVHIRRLRKILEPYGIENWIATVHGVGYRFENRNSRRGS